MTATPASLAEWSFNIDNIQASLEKKYNDISHINHPDFLTLDHGKTIIFDARQQKEFDVSHLEHAIHIDPDIDKKEFIKQFSHQLKGKYIVFYCSVGQRSSALASRLKPLLVKKNVLEVYNLKGGIFQWHNKKRPLVKNGEPTQFIHPFNSLWGLLIKNRQYIKHSPGASKRSSE